MSAEQATRLELLALGSAELRHLAEAAEEMERRAAEHHVADLMDLMFRPGLGAYLKDHPYQAPPFPADAPPLPPRRKP